MNVESNGEAIKKRKTAKVIIIALLALIILACVIMLPYAPIIMLSIHDRMAGMTDDGLYWKMTEYVECDGVYTKGETLAVHSDDEWELIEPIKKMDQMPFKNGE